MPISTATDQPFGNITRQMNKAIDGMNRGYFSFLPNDTWTPDVNLYETEETYLVCVNLAGVEKDKIDVTIENQVLKIRGARPVPCDPHGGGDCEAAEQAKRMKVHVMEIDHGSFSRDVELPHDVSHANIVANHRNGLLWIELPKNENGLLVVGCWLLAI